MEQILAEAWVLDTIAVQAEKHVKVITFPALDASGTFASSATRSRSFANTSKIHAERENSATGGGNKADHHLALSKRSERTRQGHSNQRSGGHQTQTGQDTSKDAILRDGRFLLEAQLRDQLV